MWINSVEVYYEQYTSFLQDFPLGVGFNVYMHSGMRIDIIYTANLIKMYCMYSILYWTSTNLLMHTAEY